jgi:hypothetical protein
MMKRFIKYTLIALLFCSAKNIHAASDSLGYQFITGFAGGISQQNSFSADVYVGFPFASKTGLMELNAGYTHFRNQTNFDGVKDLAFSSHGIYVEWNYFFRPKLYTGIRLAVNGNWVDEASQDKYDQVSTRKPPTYFSGTAGLGHLGFNQTLGSNVCIRLQTQLGIQNFRIANGSLLFSNTDTPTSIGYTEEKRIRLLYNLSLGLVVRI